jgi:hypothetical protein
LRLSSPQFDLATLALGRRALQDNRLTIEVHFPTVGTRFLRVTPLTMFAEYHTTDINKYVWSRGMAEFLSMEN